MMTEDTRIPPRASQAPTRSVGVQALVMPDDIAVLRAHHTGQADYYLSCKQTTAEIANKEPLYTFGDCQTKQDWLDRSSEFDQKRKYHRQRARYFINALEA